MNFDHHPSSTYIHVWGKKDVLNTEIYVDLKYPVFKMIKQISDNNVYSPKYVYLLSIFIEVADYGRNFATSLAVIYP